MLFCNLDAVYMAIYILGNTLRCTFMVCTIQYRGFFFLKMRKQDQEEGCASRKMVKYFSLVIS